MDEKMPNFYNLLDIVTQAINSLVRLSNGKLECSNGKNIVGRSDCDKTKVAVISGGGSGHEPLHVGFVAIGMLTAAVCGEIFASPSIDAILAAIIHYTGEPGCLLIVKNYMGDILNFTIAAQKARQMGFKVQIVVVADDIAIENPENRRGVAGTIFVHKIAGYLSEQGETLEYIKEKAEEVAQNIYSIGISIRRGTMPGELPADIEPEIDSGIHGEPGVKKHFNNANEAVELLAEKLKPHTEEDSEYCIQINNLGSVTPLEMNIITDEVLNRFGNIIKYVIKGKFCTSLDCHGFSLTLLKLNDEIEKALLAPTNAEAWIIPVIPQPVNQFNINLPTSSFTPSENEQNKKISYCIYNTLRDKSVQKLINHLDSIAGDGDTGYCHARFASMILEKLENKELPLNEVKYLCLAKSEILSNTGGTTGGIYAMLLNDIALQLENHNSFPIAVQNGIETLMNIANVNLGDRSLIDALYPAVQALPNISEAAKAARNGANATAQMEAKVGRARNVPFEHYEGHNDAGAEAVALVFERLNEVLKS